jgi:hypothetical protein
MWREQHGSLAVVLAVHTIAPMRAEAARDVHRMIHGDLSPRPATPLSG